MYQPQFYSVTTLFLNTTIFSCLLLKDGPRLRNRLSSIYLCQESMRQESESLCLMIFQDPLVEVIFNTIIFSPMTSQWPQSPWLQDGPIGLPSINNKSRDPVPKMRTENIIITTEP